MNRKNCEEICHFVRVLQTGTEGRTSDKEMKKRNNITTHVHTHMLERERELISEIVCADSK